VRARIVALVCAGGLLTGALTACESDADRAAEHKLERAADVSTCRRDAQPASTPYGHGFPPSWAFPARTTVYDVEDRGPDGTIVTGISSLPFKGILRYLNHDAVQAGFKITEGETEEHDAEASWAGNGYHGRWTIRESAQCQGETVIQVLAGKGS
jgi:hypothetical protein